MSVLWLYLGNTSQRLRLRNLKAKLAGRREALVEDQRELISLMAIFVLIFPTLGWPLKSLSTLEINSRSLGNLALGALKSLKMQGVCRT